MIFQLFPLFCGLAVVCLTAAATDLRQLRFWLLGCVVTVILTQLDGLTGMVLLRIDPVEVAVVIAALAVLLLWKRNWQNLAMFAAGAMAVVWQNALQSLGMPTLLALPLVAGLCGFCAYMVLRQHGFVSHRILDEALVGLFFLGLAVGVVPSAISGWQSANLLRDLDVERVASVSSEDMILLVLGFAALGLIWARWRQQKMAHSLRGTNEARN